MLTAGRNAPPEGSLEISRNKTSTDFAPLSPQREGNFPFLDRALGRRPEFLKRMEFRLVDSMKELIEVTRLVHHEYVNKGFIDPRPSGMRLIPHLALPTTATTVALLGGRIVGTMSWVQDSGLGLPMQKIYSREIAELRRQRVHAVEATLFAIDSDYRCGEQSLSRTESLLIALHLIRTGLDWIRSATPATLVLGCFHPRHDVLYRFIGMLPFGGLRHYESVNGNPAVARVLNIPDALDHLDEEPAWRFLLGHHPPPRRDYATRWTPSVADTLRLADKDPAFLGVLNDEERTWLQRLRPELDLGIVNGIETNKKNAIVRILLRIYYAMGAGRNSAAA